MLDFNKELEKFEPMEEISVNDENLPEADNVENMADILRILADNKAFSNKANNKAFNNKAFDGKSYSGKADNGKTDNKADNKTRAKK
jgi:hypothetical protein